MINFASLGFIFRFLPVFMIVYLLTPDRLRTLVLAAGSLLFYASGSLPGTAAVVILTVINYMMGAAAWSRPGRRPDAGQQRLSLTAVTLDVAVLVSCKLLARLLDTAFLPVGMSFYIFKMLSFQLDIHSGRLARKPDAGSTAAYFMMFPQLTQGPVMRFSEGGFDDRAMLTPTPRRFADGVYFFVIGLGMKVLLADRLAILWQELIRIGYASISSPLAWLGAYGYTLRLYLDFWGYSLMAAGLGMMLGFRFIVNFNHPYAASGLADFYRRWHVTLGTWFRDYVYIPMGGSREGTGRCILSLMTVWLLTGIWHGTGLNFLIWGLGLGLLIAAEKFLWKGLLEKAPFLGRLGVWILIPLSWMVFAIQDLREMGMYFSRLFPFFGTGVAVNSGDVMKYLHQYLPYLAVSLLLCFPDTYRYIVTRRGTWYAVLLALLIFWASIYRIVTSAANPFMYFTF